MNFSTQGTLYTISERIASIFFNFFTFFKYFFQYNLFIVESPADFVKTFENLVEPAPDAPVTETFSLDIPADFF